MIDEQHEHLVDIIRRWISVNGYRRRLCARSTCQAADWCVCMLCRAPQGIFYLLFSAQTEFTQEPKHLGPCVVQTWRFFSFFHFKPEKAVKKTIEGTDVECTGLNLDIFAYIYSRFTWKFLNLKKFSRDCWGQESAPYCVVWSLFTGRKLTRSL